MTRGCACLQVRDVMGDGEITKRRLVHGEGERFSSCGVIVYYQ